MVSLALVPALNGQELVSDSTIAKAIVRQAQETLGGNRLMGGGLAEPPATMRPLVELRVNRRAFEAGQTL